MQRKKAEAYVRTQIPELMEMSFGCVINNGSGHNEILVSNIGDGSYLFLNSDMQPFRYHGSIIKKHIIGHPIQLQHWLRVLREFGKYAVSSDFTLWVHGVPGWMPAFINFNQEGQPETEADYKAFNDIVGI